MSSLFGMVICDPWSSTKTLGKMPTSSQALVNPWRRKILKDIIICHLAEKKHIRNKRHGMFYCDIYIYIMYIYIYNEYKHIYIYEYIFIFEKLHVYFDAVTP